MSTIGKHKLIDAQIKCRKVVFLILITGRLCISAIQTMAEGTRQLEPIDAPANSFCRIALTQNADDFRIPFALKDCAVEYRLNVRIMDRFSEKIYLGFGSMTDYSDETMVYTDVKYQVKDPSGNIVNGFSLRNVPSQPGDQGFIETRDQAYMGPDINSTNPDGYSPLVITPSLNGDYIIEFDIPIMGAAEARVIKYLDVTVARGNTPVPGRLWSQAWQLTSASISTDDYGSYSLFYIYSNDSIITRFDCNGLAGGIWSVYSNEWGCSQNGNWNERRRSVEGNTNVKPQYKIFLNDPDPMAFPEGDAGQLTSFDIISDDCDTAILFSARVSKNGNLEILLDLPPSNPQGTGHEDVQLGYSVTSGYNILYPPWNGLDANGKAVPNGTQVIARIRFLNGLTNVPLFDVEDNPAGFKTDIRKPMPPGGNSKLNLFWDDTLIPPEHSPTINAVSGCEYTGLEPVSGCHEWTGNSGLGDNNTINSWWYYSTASVVEIPVNIKLKPTTGKISGPESVCTGQSAIFTSSILPHSSSYRWELSGNDIYHVETKASPDTGFTYVFDETTAQGYYTLKLTGANEECGTGDTAYHTIFFYHDQPPPITGSITTCSESSAQYSMPGDFIAIEWNVRNGYIVGSPDANPITIQWTTPGTDTVFAKATSIECGTRSSFLPIIIHASPTAEFSAMNEATTCPDLPLQFLDNSSGSPDTIISRHWEWGDGTFQLTTGLDLFHTFPTEGIYETRLQVITNRGCQATTKAWIHVIPNPRAGFTSFRNCIATPVEITDESTGQEITRWQWNFGPQSTYSSGLNQQKPAVQFDTEGRYHVNLVIQNKYGCTDTLQQTLVIHPHPDAGFSHTLPCHGKETAFTDQTIQADTIIGYYEWNISSPSRVGKIYYGNPADILFDDPGEYRLKYIVQDYFGCSDTTFADINVNKSPECAFSWIENWEGHSDLLHLVNNTTDAVSYSWDFGNNESSTLKEPDIRYSMEDEYLIRLIAISLEGCIDTVSSTYYYSPGIWLPSAFSPDHDGKNDIFRPVTQRNTLEPYLLQILNNWGQIIFSSTVPSVGWDGTYHGSPCHAGEYLFILRYRKTGTEGSSQVQQKGFVTLIR